MFAAQVAAQSGDLSQEFAQRRWRGGGGVAGGRWRWASCSAGCHWRSLWAASAGWTVDSESHGRVTALACGTQRTRHQPPATLPPQAALLSWPHSVAPCGRYRCSRVHGMPVRPLALCLVATVW